MRWKISFDPDKREWTLRDYGERRRITVGFLTGRMVIVVWVGRDKTRHVVSMRKANEREIKAYRQQFEEG